MFGAAEMPELYRLLGIDESSALEAQAPLGEAHLNQNEEEEEEDEETDRERQASVCYRALASQRLSNFEARHRPLLPWLFQLLLKHTSRRTRKKRACQVLCLKASRKAP